MEVVCHLWTCHLSAFHSVKWVNQLVYESIHFHESCHSFESFKECIVHCHIMSWHLPRQFKCLQVFGHDTLCSKGKLSWEFTPPVKREIVLRVYKFLCQLLLSQSYGYIIFKFQNFVPSFVSLIWDSSWPSFDETIPVNINSSSGN